MNNKTALSSLAMDLKRVALGYYRGSFKVGDRFLEEALKRVDEVDTNNFKPYLSELLGKVRHLKEEKDKEKLAEDALLYSIIIQNAAVYYRM